MTFSNFSQLIIAALFFMVFTFCTWYEGSEILDRPWEWKYSTHFTQVNDDQAMDPDDISSLIISCMPQNSSRYFHFLWS